MNYLAGTLIHHMNPEKLSRGMLDIFVDENNYHKKDYSIIDNELESDVFWIIVHIMKKKGWAQVYSDGTPGLMKMLNELERRIQKELPRLAGFLDEVSNKPLISNCK